MNNPRGTYMNKTKPNTHLTSANTLDRTTVNNMSVTKLQQEKKLKQQDRMISRILEVIGKLENPTNTPAISRETLKLGSSKAFFDVLCIFMRAIDGSTERTDITNATSTELLLDTLKFFGYKATYNKSTFQPIGAPHTWNQCLSILEWFSQLATFAFRFKAGLQENAFGEDLNSMILTAFNTRKEQPIRVHLAAEVEHLEGDITKKSYIVQSKQMAIKNQHAAQKELSQVERQLDKEKELTYRARQEEMAIQGEVRAVEATIQAKQQELAQAQEKQAQVQAALDKVRYEILHQELPPEECEKIKLEIRDIKNKISQIEEGIGETTDVQKTVNNQYLERFTDQNSHLRKLADKLAASPLLTDIEAKPQMPILAPFQLRQVLLRCADAEGLDLQSEAKLESAFKEREFGQYFRKYDELINKLETRLGREEETLMAKEQEIQGLDSKSKDFQENITRLDRSKKAKLSKVSLHQAQKKDLQRALIELQAQTHSFDQQISQQSIQRDQLLQEVKESLADLKDLEQVCRENERIRKEKLSQTREKLDRYKQTCIDKITQYKREVTAIFSRKFEGKPQTQ